MRCVPLGMLALGFAAISLVSYGADSAADPNPTEAAAVRVGTSTMTVSRLNEAYARLRSFQRQKFGNTSAAQVRGYVENVVVRDLLLAERGKTSGMLDSARVKAQHRALLGQALVQVLRAKLERENPVTDTDVKNYYDMHPEVFKTPKRIRILRLLVDTEVEASELIDKARHLPNMDDWRNLVREKSRDKATSERGGELGFVAADGSTDVPELEVDRALFAAADGVKDGELVPKPVAEGPRFAVVWRRGSVSERVLELKQEAARIRMQLSNERLDEEIRETLLRLRRDQLRGYRPELVTDRELPER